MLSTETKRNIFRIIPFGVIWLTFGLIYLLLEKGIIGDLNYYPSTGNPYDFKGNSLLSLIIISVSGLLVGVFEIMFLDNLFINKSFSKKILYKTLIYVVIMITFLLIFTTIVNTIELQTSIFDDRVWNNVWVFASSFTFWSVELYIAAIIGVSLFYSEVSENLGLFVLHNFFVGKYHKPIEEERVFMFLDMKSSTTIAENLGHVKYFEMLKEYYSDLSNPIIHYSGEIYQYIGDEIVVSWKIKNGLKDNNCLNCFFAMKESLSKQSEKYQSQFGILPTFKAGFHFGRVTTGEIGVIKKDIIFTGDVLNTTARIQGLCNDYNVDILISDQLRNKMDIESEFNIQSQGIHELRGRNETIKLFTIGSPKKW
jgi:adenylate cyclase